jgi:hypothetical protein
MDIALAHEDYPRNIQIGTNKAFAQHTEYHYVWAVDDRRYVCNKTTRDGLEGENLVINYLPTHAGHWYVATEGTFSAGVFHGRRQAFRTREQFYLAGFHNWQVNKESSDRASNWEDRDDYALRAETKIPDFAGFVTVTSHPQLALAA